ATVCFFKPESKVQRSKYRYYRGLWYLFNDDLDSARNDFEAVMKMDGCELEKVLAEIELQKRELLEHCQNSL
ncbi:MAG: hypothetical protein ACLFQV_12560, partial [Vulcanimicrobiota bacterium]